MSELFDDDPRAERPVKQRSGPSRALLITAIVLVLLVFGLTGFASIYTDRLWFSSVGYGQVFSTMLWTRIGLFLAFGLVMGAVVALNVYLAFRFRPLFRPTSPEQGNLDRYREVVTPIRTWLVVAVAVVVGAFAGTSGMGNWRTFLLWRNAQSFGTNDPYFDRDIGFYVFHLPWLHYLVDFAMATMVIALIAAVVVHYLYGGIRLQVAHDRFSGAAQAQLSVLVGLFVLAKGADYYLDRFDLVNQQGRLFTGMNFTAENAVLPAKNILLGVAVICAILFFLNVWRRTWQLPSVGLALLVLSAVLLGMIWPAVVQQFQVKPSEADKEAPYIETNIDATRAAYDLTDVETTDYDGDVAIDDVVPSQLAQQTSSLPLIDPRLVRDTFEQTQQGRAYYSVAPVLDVDRYEIDGTERALVLGARELDQGGLSEGDRNWSNLHTVYTHGNGLIAAYANQRTEGNVERAAGNDDTGGIAWAEGNQPGQDTLSTLDGGYESRIYFGEQSPTYSVVGKADEGDGDVELGLNNAADSDQTTTYDGDGGVPVGSAFNQLMFGIKFGEANFLLSGRVNENSEVLYNRTPRTRVEKVAPWLTVDSDAYPAVVDGKIVWILDGYTTTDQYPGAQRESFETMTTDSQQVDTGFQTLPTDEINYMRNAVKATVDAYDGTVTLYEWDQEDPMLKAWMGAFPDSVQPNEEIPEELREHLRYPEDFFKAQRYQFARYHVEDAGDWYQGNDRWEVPQDPNSTSNALQPPYRLLTDQDGDAEGGSEWSLSSVFVPFQRNNLASFLSVDSDAQSETYGQLRVLEMDDQTTPGPGLIANEFAQDPDVREELLRFTQGNTPPIFGNLLTLPVADGLIYIEPVYAARSGSASSYPILQYVLVSYGDNVGIGTTLTGALASALGVDVEGGDPTPPDPQQPGGGEQLPINQQIRQALVEAETAFAAADTALADGDLAEYQTQVEAAQAALDQALSLANQRGGTGSGTGSGAPTDGATDAPTDGATDAPTDAPTETPSEEAPAG